MKTTLALVLPCLLLGSVHAEAAWKRPAQVRYETDAGFTPWTTANVAFATGRELNRTAAIGAQYNSEDGRFAVIPMTDGKYNVVRLSGYAACGLGFTSDCLPGGRADGFDGSGRHWQLCTNPKCN